MLTLRPKWWQWPTVLSLDAPAVALLWQGLLARTARVQLGGAPVFVLGSSVWLAYAADRWLEGWRLHPERIRTQRHHFYQTWRWPVAAVWAAVFAADLFAAVRGLGRREFLGGALLLGPVAAYLLSHQLVHRHHRGRAPKELCVALLLAAGVGVFPVVRSPSGAQSWGAPLALFGLLCFTNCALISVWEDEVDRSHGQTSFARQFRRGRTLSRALPWLAAACSLGLAVRWRGPEAAAAGCALASGLLLAAVDRAERRLGRERARVLADVALMTPLIPLLGTLGR